MKLKKLTMAGLAAVAVLGLASCGKQTPSEKNESLNSATGATTDKDLDIYEAQLSDFLSVYNDAKTKTNVNEKFAYMAKAEAELLSSAVFIPTSTLGGNYALGKVAPRTAPYALWGSDEYRYKNLVVTNELMKASDRQALLEQWEAHKGTEGYDSVEYAKTYLTSKGYTFTDTYVYQYTAAPKTFDWLATSQQTDSEVVTNIVDGLVEYNGENELVPALATSATPERTENADGTVTYTFEIKSGLKWYKNDGTATNYDITADDFVAGFQHMLDAAGGLEYLVQGVIVGVDEYLSGEITDFSQVGVKAEGNKVSYTLIKDLSYFETYLSYSIYQPLCRAYFLEQGGAFGRQAFAEASNSSTYTYGKSKDNVLSCGAYYIKTYGDNSTIEYEMNPGYWDQDIEIKHIKWLYNDNSDQLKGYNWLKDNQISGAGLNTAAIEQAKKDGLFDTYAYVTDTTSTTYFAAYNLNRQTYVLSNGAVASKQSEKQAVDTYKAIQNRNFRLALSYAFDKANWNAQQKGEDLALTALRNSYIPYDFVSLTDEITVTVGSENKTYAAGTAYGKILQDYCDALGLDINVKDGVNGWYNVDNAKATMAKAVEELAADGLTINSDNKIHLDLFYLSTSDVQTKQATSYKQSVEAALGDYVVVDLVECTTPDDYYNAGYYAPTGADGNYNVFYGSGWGPDYGDPSTYLDTFLPEGAGYMTRTIGLW